MTDNIVPIDQARQRDLTTDRLWTIDDLAEWLQVSKVTAYRVVAAPSFPRAIKIAGKIRRWVPKDVRAWSERQK